MGSRSRSGCAMLAAYPATTHEGTALKDALWVDLVDPIEEERKAIQQAFGLRVPSRDQLAEIETTSRLRIENGALYLTAPLIFAADSEPWIVVPAGFVLSQRVLLTVRFDHLAAFDTVIAELGRSAQCTPALAFVRLLETIVDRIADLLEISGRDLDDASHVIFRPDARRQKLSKETAQLRRLMLRSGRTSERMARIHYTLVCVDRMAKFSTERGHDWIAPELSTRLQRVSSDISSLIHFAEGLVSRVQLLQDAATGIINIDQNDVIKVLTIASVVGIPPVLIAGIYGMNFKNMPEYDWPWGYAYALIVIAVSAMLPLIWFKWKDWI
jgi:magnesium transporter